MLVCVKRWTEFKCGRRPTGYLLAFTFSSRREVLASHSTTTSLMWATAIFLTDKRQWWRSTTQDQPHTFTALIYVCRVWTSSDRQHFRKFREKDRKWTDFIQPHLLERKKKEEKKISLWFPLFPPPLPSPVHTANAHTARDDNKRNRTPKPFSLRSRNHRSCEVEEKLTKNDRRGKMFAHRIL